MMKGFPLESIKEIVMSRDHHEAKQFLVTCKVVRAFLPAALTQKRGTMYAIMQLGDTTFQSPEVTTRYPLHCAAFSRGSDVLA